MRVWGYGLDHLPNRQHGGGKEINLNPVWADKADARAVPPSGA